MQFYRRWRLKKFDLVKGLGHAEDPAHLRHSPRYAIVLQGAAWSGIRARNLLFDTEDEYINIHNYSKVLL